MFTVFVCSKGCGGGASTFCFLGTTVRLSFTPVLLLGIFTSSVEKLKACIPFTSSLFIFCLYLEKVVVVFSFLDSD